MNRRALRIDALRLGRVFGFLGALVYFLGLLMLPALALAYVDDRPEILRGFFHACVGTLGLGLLLRLGCRKAGDPAGKDAFGIVVFGWTLSGVLCAAPFILSGTTGPVDGLFESFSGLTTTGATIFRDVDGLPPGLLLWRSIIQWIGGLGIVLVVTVLLGQLESTGVDILRAEVSVLSQKIKPRLADTGFVLTKIYAGLTALEVVLLRIGGMDFFDALCHSLTTMATGGFSTRTQSLGGLGPYAEIVTILFMTLAATSFFVHYRFLRGDLLAYWRSPEFRWMVLVMLAGGLLLAGSLLTYAKGATAEQAIRDGVYQAVSFTTTTGYTTADQTSWPAVSRYLLVLLMFVGGSVGSTAGSLKIRRWIIVIQAIVREMRRILYPNRVASIRVGSETIEEPVVRRFVLLVLLWILIFVAGGLALLLMGVDPETALSASASSLGNVGPALGGAGAHMADLPGPGKLLLAALMLLGRLEILIVVVMFSPAVWRRPGAEQD